MACMAVIHITCMGCANANMVLDTNTEHQPLREFSRSAQKAPGALSILGTDTQGNAVGQFGSVLLDYHRCGIAFTVRLLTIFHPFFFAAHFLAGETHPG